MEAFSFISNLIVLGGNVMNLSPENASVKNYERISEKTLENRAEEWGVSKSVLRSFFKILEEAEVDPEHGDNTLCEVVTRYKDLLTGLEDSESDDPGVTRLRRQAEEVLKAGDFEQAEKFLYEAFKKHIKAARHSSDEHINQYLLSAAASAAEIGDLRNIILDYEGAVGYFCEAAELVPQGSELILAKYLKKWGVAAYDAGDYAGSEVPLTRALKIKEKVLGKNHAETGDCFNNLGLVYNDQGKYEEAESLFKQALKIVKDNLGADHPNVAATLNNLALLYGGQGRYEEAEPLFEQAVDIMDKHVNILQLCKAVC
ncbi:tetratricopeptide repeat protein [Desulfococcaceae bacterium HSG8]|nr:tetratricopeptide repeat protein [Desulfococcaceae bacterium HSG8]